MDEKTGAAAGTGCLFCETVRPILERAWNDVTMEHLAKLGLIRLSGTAHA